MSNQDKIVWGIMVLNIVSWIQGNFLIARPIGAFDAAGNFAEMH